MYNLVWKGKTPDEDHIANTYDTWREMQEVAGEIIDSGRDKEYYIVHCINDKIVGTYNVKDFVSRTQPGNFTIDLPSGKKPSKDLARDRFRHLDEKETAEVLKHTPTGALIGELARRANEYESTVEKIYKLLDSMKVYDVNH